jgi:dynein heavy chain
MRDDPGYHAKCPHYTRDKRYVWTPVQVIGYDEEGEKYMVRVIENNTVKYVGRLSLMMKNESEKNFKARLLQCKHLQKQAEDELRFYRYVDSLDDGLVATLPEWQLKRIVEAIRRSKRKAAKKRRGTALTSLG